MRFAEDAWNSRDPSAVARAYTPDTQWRNRSEFLRGRDEVEAFLRRKWAAEHEYKLIKQLWAHSGDRIAVTFQYEYRSAADGQYWRAYGNELYVGRPAMRHSQHAERARAHLGDDNREHWQLAAFLSPSLPASDTLSRLGRMWLQGGSSPRTD